MGGRAAMEPCSGYSRALTYRGRSWVINGELKPPMRSTTSREVDLNGRLLPANIPA